MVYTLETFSCFKLILLGIYFAFLWFKPVPWYVMWENAVLKQIHWFGSGFGADPDPGFLVIPDPGCWWLKKVFQLKKFGPPPTKRTSSLWKHEISSLFPFFCWSFLSFWSGSADQLNPDPETLNKSKTSLTQNDHNTLDLLRTFL